MTEERIGGIVLCGGQSVRMGRPKEWLTVGDETLLQRTVRLIGGACAPIVVVGRKGQSLPSLPADVEVIADTFAEAGPLAGIEAGLAALNGRCEMAIVTACDHPRMRAEVLVRLVALAAGHPALIVEHEGRSNPLLGVYRTALAVVARSRLERGERAVHRFAEECQAVVISSEAFRDLDPTLESLLNANDFETFARATDNLRPTV